MSAFAAHFTPSQQTQASNFAAAATNPDVDAQQAPQANAGKSTPQHTKQRRIGLGKKQQIVCYACSGVFDVCIELIKSSPLSCAVSAGVGDILKPFFFQFQLSWQKFRLGLVFLKNT